MSTSGVASRDGNTGRSIWSIVAGFLAVVVLSIATDAILRAAHIYPALGERMGNGLFVLATAYRAVFGVLGSYVTARLAPQKPMKHALIGAAIGMLVGSIGAVATWNKDLGPHWYPLLLVVLGAPQAWVGAKLYLLSQKRLATA